MVHLIRVREGAVLNDESHQQLPSIQLQVTMMRHGADNLDHALFHLSATRERRSDGSSETKTKSLPTGGCVLPCCCGLPLVA